MGVLNDLLGFLGVLIVIGHLIQQVTVIRFHLDEMLPRRQAPFHKPGLKVQRRRHGNAVGIHDPFQITGHVISFQAQDVFEF